MISPSDWSLEFIGENTPRGFSGGDLVGLRNLFSGKFVEYKTREYGVNLSWSNTNPANLQLVTVPGSAQIAYGDPVALVLQGAPSGKPYLRYGEQTNGINLRFSSAPAFQWIFTGGTLGVPALSLTPTGVFNRIEHDQLIYCERSRGINLAWLKDCKEQDGKRVRPSAGWFDGIINKVTGLIDEGINVLAEVGWRLVGLPDFVLSLLGIRLPKKLRVKGVILRDEDNDQLVSEITLREALNEASNILKARTNTRLVAAGSSLINIDPAPAPTGALDVACDSQAFLDDFGAAGGFFRERIGLNVMHVVAFVVREVAGDDKTGCSLGPLSNYVTVSVRGVIDHSTQNGRGRTLAHEIAHACGLWHEYGSDSLMNPGGSGTYMSFLEIAIFRNSRHVTFW